MTKIYKQNQIEELSKILNNNGVISYPTDTVFGICGKIDSKIVFEKLMNLKKRPKNKSFPIMCSDLEQIKKVAIVNEKTELIIKKFMPGPITLVLKKKDNIPSYISNGKDTIAVRMAPSKNLQELIKKINSPIFMTSANISNEPVCKNIEEIEQKLKKLDAIVEGKVQYKEASTIVDCSKEKIEILREGPIKYEDIKNIENEDLI